MQKQIQIQRSLKSAAEDTLWDISDLFENINAVAESIIRYLELYKTFLTSRPILRNIHQTKNIDIQYTHFSPTASKDAFWIRVESVCLLVTWQDKWPSGMLAVVILLDLEFPFTWTTFVSLRTALCRRSLGCCLRPVVIGADKLFKINAFSKEECGRERYAFGIRSDENMNVGN